VNFIEKTGVLTHLARWRLSWDKRDIDYKPPGHASAKFMSARDATMQIRDGSVVVSCGLAANARCSIFFWAVREQFELNGSPAGLTWISVGAQGGRGRVPGTVDELALPGLVTRYISGHVETARAMLQLAQQSALELHLLPQGEMTHLIEIQGNGQYRLESTTGLNTFLDPGTGVGSPVGAGENLVRNAGSQLEYRLPPIDVAIINAPYADRDGNIYFRHAATMTESIEAARAAKFNGGKVLVAVSEEVPHAPAEVTIPASQVDAIVINPRNEQTGGIPQRKYWDLFTTESRQDAQAAIRKLRFANDVLGFTPARGRAELAVARLGASLFTREVSPGATVNLGVGYGEELVRVLCEQGLHKDVTFTTETGVYGGVPAPGIYFGAAVNPQRLESSAWMFHHYRDHLDATVLGFLQVDFEGNVNGSHRSDTVSDLVGPGGLPSIVASARTILFIGGWMKGARWSLKNGELRLIRAGQPKFVERVRSVTFSAKTAIAAGKKVFYVTNVGIFRLTENGLALVEVMPGVNIEEDILKPAGGRINLPGNGPVPCVSPAVVTGRGFKLQWMTGDQGP
jgi:propionate CoA-transferase